MEQRLNRMKIAIPRIAGQFPDRGNRQMLAPYDKDFNVLGIARRSLGLECTPCKGRNLVEDECGKEIWARLDKTPWPGEGWMLGSWLWENGMV